MEHMKLLQMLQMIGMTCFCSFILTFYYLHQKLSNNMQAVRGWTAELLLIELLLHT